MGLINGILGGVGGALGLADKRAKDQERQRLVNNYASDLNAWFNRNYYENATQNADTQRLLSSLEDYISRRNKGAEGRAVLTGGTDESIDAEREANNKLMSDAVSGIAARNVARKDAISNQYMQGKQGIMDRKLGFVDKEAGKHEEFDAVFGNMLSGLGVNTSY